MNYSPNLNIAWSSLLVRTLIKNGIDHYFISPGYRNAPLVAGLKEAGAKCFSCVDERSASYMALGCSKASGFPSVFVCTSGTAGANALPAVIEAHKDQIPMIVLTADRPIDLVHSGANQAVDQSLFFQGFCKTYVPMPIPGDTTSPEKLVGLVEAAVSFAVSEPNGVSHINQPFVSPLEPVENITISTKEFDQFSVLHDTTPSVNVQPKSQDLAALGRLICEAKRPLLIVGRMNHDVDITSIESFCERFPGLVYYDVGSQLSFSKSGVLDPELLAMRASLKAYSPDMVVQLGENLVTKYFSQYLESATELKSYLIYTLSQGRLDYSFRQARQYRVNHFRWLDDVTSFKQSDDVVSFSDFEEKANQIIEAGPLSWPLISRTILASSERSLFLGNSSAVRAFDTFAFGRYPQRKVYLNRGVSGIEGLLSTAIGITAYTQEPLDLVLGDLSMLHDLNALVVLSQLDLPIRVIVVNNHSGGIFAKLPIGKFFDQLDPFISTPHQLDFSDFARAVNVDYKLVSNNSMLKTVFKTSNPRPELIEIHLQTDQDLDILNKLNSLEL